MKWKHGAARGFVVAYGVAMMVHQVVWLSHYGAAAYIRTQVYSLNVSALKINGFLAAVLAYLDFTAFHASVFVPALCILQYVLVCDMVVLKVCFHLLIIQPPPCFSKPEAVLSFRKQACACLNFKNFE